MISRYGYNLLSSLWQSATSQPGPRRQRITYLEAFLLHQKVLRYTADDQLSHDCRTRDLQGYNTSRIGLAIIFWPIRSLTHT
jgi:hypothetical protein